MKINRKLWRAGALTLAGAAMLAACGDDDASSDPTAAPAATAAAPAAAGGDYGYALPEPATTAGTAAPASDAAVATTETSIGAVLVDANGLTLYAFTEDNAGEPTCVETCAGAWPPALVEGEPTFGDLDASLFTTVDHPEGTQLKAGDFPLYTFAGDTAAGDVNGQGSGGVWFAVAADGTLID